MNTALSSTSAAAVDEAAGNGAAAAIEPVPHLVGGRARPGVSGRTAPVFNPATGHQTGELPLAGVGEVDEAIATAAAAFDEWRGVSVARRTKLMFAYRNLVEEYAEDARRMVRYLDDRDDVDRDRITVIGHAEGGWPAMLAAARERRADNLVLIGAPATSGAELVLEQQTAMLDRMNAPERERTEMIGLQRRIIDAVRDDGSWEGVPDAMRRQADTYWFRSFLEFDVADALRRTRQPLLIVHGSRDTHVGPHHARRLAEFAGRRRRGSPPPEQTILEGLDHRLVPAGPDASTAEAASAAPSISPTVVDTLTTWLNQRRNDR